jgi:hypothetical protein
VVGYEVVDVDVDVVVLVVVLVVVVLLLVLLHRLGEKLPIYFVKPSTVFSVPFFFLFFY